VNGQELVSAALDIATNVLKGIQTSGALDGDSLTTELDQACKDLDGIKGRPTLRTKNGTNQAFPVREAADHLEEAWDDAEGGGDTNELRAMLTEFVDAATTLKESLKGRTVIMT
jgi:hypothetical protein